MTSGRGNTDNEQVILKDDDDSGYREWLGDHQGSDSYVLNAERNPKPAPPALVNVAPTLPAPRRLTYACIGSESPASAVAPVYMGGTATGQWRVASPSGLAAWRRLPPRAGQPSRTAASAAWDGGRHEVDCCTRCNQERSG